MGSVLRSASERDGGGERLRVLRVIARMNVGGPARQVTALARGLDPGRFEHQLLVGTVGPSEADDIELRGLDLPHVRVPGLGQAPSPMNDTRAWASIAAELRRFRPHIMHTHTAKAGVLGRTAALAASLGAQRPKLVHTFHGHVLNGYFSPRVTRAIVAVERMLAVRTDRLVAVGARVRDELLAAGVGRPDQYEVVPPGVALRSVPAQADARRALGLPSEAPVVAFVARLIPVKRPDRFVEAARLIAKRCPTAVFVIAGDGPLARDSRALVAAAGLGDRVRFVGWRPDVEAVYASSDVVALTSDNEGMPVSLVEAALAGRPVVTTDAGSAAEVVVHRETGLVVDREPKAVAAGVERLLADPAMRAAMGAAAAERARHIFSVDRLVRDTELLYEEIVTRMAIA